MDSWRMTIATGAVAAAVAVAVGWYAGTWVVLLPVVASAAVLVVAALTVDYFGWKRTAEGWHGTPDDCRPATLRARALSVRFHQLQETGSPRTPMVARSYLLALAECGRFREAGPVVDFLGADAVFGRVGTDPVADAMRAVALAELGRAEQARRLARQLLASRRGRLAIVGYAWARVAVLDGRAAAGIEQIDCALQRRCPPRLQRDLLILRARACTRLGRTEQAATSLRELCAQGRRREVERLADAARAGEPALSVAATRALCAAAPYR